MPKAKFCIVYNVKSSNGREVHEAIRAQGHRPISFHALRTIADPTWTPFKRLTPEERSVLIEYAIARGYDVITWCFESTHPEAIALANWLAPLTIKEEGA